MFHRPTISGIRLDAAGLIALADLKTIARRTALIGSASFLDVLYLSPGIHCQQDASEINGGEYPLTGAMHSAGGWVFRVENPATVSFLQGVGKSGHLTTVRVSKETKEGTLGLFGELLRTEFWASILFLIGVVTSVVVIVLLVTVFRDWWALGVLGMLMGARVLNVCVIKLRQDKHGFKGSKEGNVEGDLLVILSQDRWVRMRGGVDDIKEVTAGQWLREPETLESFAVSFATLLVYCSAALAGNTTTAGSLLLACLLLFSAGILGLANAATHSLHMFGRMVTVEDEPLRYERRLTMVKDMIQETRHTEWALRMSMITEPEVADLKKAIERDSEATPIQTPTGAQDMATLVNRGSRSNPALPLNSAVEPELPPGGIQLGLNNGCNLEQGLSARPNSERTISTIEVADLPSSGIV